MGDENREAVKPLALIGDEPVYTLVDDRLSLRNFAETIAAVSLGTEGPFTIGVFGRWGHGKTSLLRLSMDLVDQQEREDVTTAWFNAWQYEKEPHPIVPLVATIIRALEEHLARRPQAKIKKGAAALTRALRAVAYGFSAKTRINIPGVAEVEAGFVAKEMIDREEKLKGQSVDPLLDQSLYYNAFQLLARLGGEETEPADRPKIVVFIDDLDRCFPKNAVHLLESIKLVLAQPGFVFVLAVDKRVIEGYLNKRYRDDYGLLEYQQGQSYLDKIIQLPFAIPSHMQRFEDFIARMLDREELKDLAAAFKPTQQIIGPTCNYNPREVVRFFNGILVDSFIWGRVNPGDAFDAGVFTVARSLQNQCDHIYRLMLRDAEFCKALTEGEGDVRDRLYRLRDTAPRVARQPEVAGDAEAAAMPEDMAKWAGEHERLVRFWSPEHDQAVKELLGREHLCELLDSEPGQRWLGDEELRRRIEQFIAVQRAEPEEPPDKEPSVPKDILRAIEAAEKGPRIADADSPDYWVTIPAGKFWMGAQAGKESGRNFDPEARSSESPVHEVSHGEYRIGRYPVTVVEYDEFKEAGGYGNKDYWKAGGFGKWEAPGDWEKQTEYRNRPVTEVSWYEASAYASWKGARLPSEAEWERAARGEEGRRYPWGDDPPTPRMANFGLLLGRPSPVGVYVEGVTPERIHDLAGNVWEWCRDVWHESYNGAPADGSACTTGGKGSGRVLRGGSWHSDEIYLRSAYRRRNTPDNRVDHLAFRVAAGT